MACVHLMLRVANGIGATVLLCAKKVLILIIVVTPPQGVLFFRLFSCVFHTLTRGCRCKTRQQGCDVCCVGWCMCDNEFEKSTKTTNECVHIGYPHHIPSPCVTLSFPRAHLRFQQQIKDSTLVSSSVTWVLRDCLVR